VGVGLGTVVVVIGVVVLGGSVVVVGRMVVVDVGTALVEIGVLTVVAEGTVVATDAWFSWELIRSRSESPLSTTKIAAAVAMAVAARIADPIRSFERLRTPESSEGKALFLWSFCGSSLSKGGGGRCAHAGLALGG
jgi:hypothetical protein